MLLKVQVLIKYVYNFGRINFTNVLSIEFILAYFN